MPIQERKTKQLRLPLLEFQDVFKIEGKITHVDFYKSCKDPETDDKTEYLNISVELE